MLSNIQIREQLVERGIKRKTFFFADTQNKFYENNDKK